MVGLYHLSGGAILHGFHQDGVAVTFSKDHDVLISQARFLGEPASLVGINFHGGVVSEVKDTMEYCFLLCKRPRWCGCSLPESKKASSPSLSSEGVVGLVDRSPLGVLRPWPLCVSSESGKCLRTNCLFLMAASQVGLVGNLAEV